MSEISLSKIDDMIEVVLDFYKENGITNKNGEEMHTFDLWNELTFKDFERQYTIANLYYKIKNNPYLLHVFEQEKVSSMQILGYTDFKASGDVNSVENENFGDCYISLKEVVKDYHSYYVPTVTKEQFDNWEKIMIEKKLISDEQLMDVLSFVTFPEETSILN